jgi:predicted nuclease of restriction endonuclease-like (RecB) superfamily
MKLSELVNIIKTTHQQSEKNAWHEVNMQLAVRNWLIGFYLFEFEQKGVVRAAFGKQLYKRIAEQLKKKNVKGMSFTNLHLFKQFYLTYPQFVQTVSEQMKKGQIQIVQTASEQFKIPKSSIKSRVSKGVSQSSILSKLSFSHFVELLKIEENTKRLFYETECIRNGWSVRDLNRAISTLLYERTHRSKNKKVVIAKIKGTSKLQPEDILKDPYIFDFLDIGFKSEFSESDLEESLINHLQKFLIELGRGFCFEARQKRITFDNQHYFIDLVFYHRILKCHVLIDLKIGAFDHADAGQMNLYLNYYKEEEGSKDDNPPIGIVLCAHKNEAMVKYATGGLSKKMFVGKYLVNLPTEEELKRLIVSDTEAIYARNQGVSDRELIK